MLAMIRRFVKTKKDLLNLFVELGLEELMVIVLGSEMICRREATLLTAEDALKWLKNLMFKKIIWQTILRIL